MRVLLDECVPKRLRQALTGHDAKTVTEMGWTGKKNGALLALMTAAGFEVLLTVDRNLRFQQNLSGASVALLVLVGRGTRVVDLLPLIPAALAALSTIKPGEIVEVQ